MTVQPRPVLGLRAPVAAALGAVVALGGDLVMDPAHRHVPLCPFHEATGWWCPLCGGLRSAQALAHGHLGVAMRDNAVFVVALPLLVWAWTDWTRRARAGKPARRPSRLGMVAIIALGIVFTVVRNLPAMTGLRPG